MHTQLSFMLILYVHTCNDNIAVHGSVMFSLQITRYHYNQVPMKKYMLCRERFAGMELDKISWVTYCGMINSKHI